MYKLTKLGPDGEALRDDHAGHLAVLLEHSLLARPITWTAHHSGKRLTWKQAHEWAASLNTCGWQWRLPTVEEAFMLPDRSRATYPLVDPAFFPDCEGEWVWTATEQAAGAGGAWDVSLANGNSTWDRHGYGVRVRAVRASQP